MTSETFVHNQKKSRYRIWITLALNVAESLKRGRKPSTPTQEPHGKRRPTIPTEFTTRHFDTTTWTPADQAAHEECSSELRVQISSLFSCEQLPTNARDILPLPAVSEKNASSGDEEINKPQASEILMDAGLRNSQVSFMLFLRFKINGARRKKVPGKKKKNLLRGLRKTCYAGIFIRVWINYPY